MVFNSFNFWLIFPFIFVIYWLIPRTYNSLRKLFLVIVSYLLYMNWEPAFSLVLAGVTLITYWGGYFIGFTKITNKRKLLFGCFVVLGVLPLIIFKYYNFINDSITSGLEFLGLHFSLPGLNWAIPVGISFYTFQAIGYLMDVYKRRITSEKNLLDYALFVSFFPQVTSGPISNGTELLPQIKAPHPFLYKQGKEGLKLLLWGMFLKCVVADRLGMYVDTVYGNYEHFSGLNCFVASIFYTIQIYGDFAGYSLMAIGIAKTLGFDLVNNFKRPYFATSITEFWHRWHISLTRWLTTHVYINLGGSRCSKAKQYWNILVTFLVSGLWHGANWTFVVWGLFHGVIQIIEKVLGIDPKGRNFERLNSVFALRPIRIMATFLLVNFAWIFFRMPTINDAIGMIERMFASFGGQVILEKANNADKLFIVIALLTLVSVEIWTEYFHDKVKMFNCRYVRFCAYIVLFCMIISMGVLDASSFIYVSF